MINFCKKKIHAFLSLYQEPPREESPHLRRNIPSPACGLSLIAGETTTTPANFLDSSAAAAIKASSIATVIAEKKDSAAFGFLDGLNGLVSCTESLGFESSDERCDDHQMDPLEELSMQHRSTAPAQSRWRRTMGKVRREDMRFPPPLPSLNKNGQPTFYLKPVRKNGTLELIEVRIDRPEILLASRQDGRLRLQLIRSDPLHQLPPQKEDEEDEEVLPEEEDEVEEIEEEEDEVEEEEEEEEEGIEEEGERNNDQWQFPSTIGDGYRRCQELCNHRQQHHLPLWNHHCVTIR